MLAQQLINGVLLGSTYALFALGFTLMFGVLKVVNLTYGFYFSAGAFFALHLTKQWIGGGSNQSSLYHRINWSAPIGF